MKIVKNTALIILAILGWTAFIVYGGLMNGFLLKKINTEDTPQSFVEVIKEKVNDEFVGTFVMTLIEDGEVSK